MKLKGIKLLKIVGIIALISGVLALAIWGIITLVNREKVYINAFSTEIEKEIDTKKTAFDNTETKRSDLYNFINLNFKLRLAENENLTQRINLVKNNFSTIGLNLKERKTIDEIVTNLTKYRASLSSIYSELEQISNKTTISDSDAATFKNVFKESYLTNYDLIITEKIKLFNLLEDSLNKHKVTMPSYINSLINLSNLAIDMSQKINLAHIKTYSISEASLDYSTTLLSEINKSFIAINQNLKTYDDANLASLIVELDEATATLKENFDSFLLAFNNLTELEKQTLSNNGTGFDYTITPATNNLKIVVDFLKENGTYHTAVNLDGTIIKGIQL